MPKPKRTKHNKVFKGRNRGSIYQSVDFGEYGLKATENAEMTERQVEAARKILRREMKRLGKLYIRVCEDTPRTKKPLEVRQGKGKGPIDRWVAKIQPGRMLYEIEGVSEEVAYRAFKLASDKLPFKTVVVKRTVM